MGSMEATDDDDWVEKNMLKRTIKKNPNVR
jgi:hypothetical protein